MSGRPSVALNGYKRPRRLGANETSTAFYCAQITSNNDKKWNIILKHDPKNPADMGSKRIIFFKGVGVSNNKRRIWLGGAAIERSSYGFKQADRK